MKVTKNKKKNPAAVALGKIKSKKKAEASKRNGKLGGYPKGRPRKAKKLEHNFVATVN